MKKLLSILFFLCNVPMLESSQPSQNLITALELASQLLQSTTLVPTNSLKKQEQTQIPTVTPPTKKLAATPSKTQRVPEFILTVGDLMKLPVDCIVNAANSNIQGGGGIDGIITENRYPSSSNKAGQQYSPPVGDISKNILQELQILKNKKPDPIASDSTLPEGQAVITSSGSIINQNAKTVRFVIATVGPQGHADVGKDFRLYNCYYNSLLRAIYSKETYDMLHVINHYLAENYKENPIRSVAFPSISTGIFGYDYDRAAPAAIGGILSAMNEHPDKFDIVRLVVTSDAMMEVNKTTNKPQPTVLSFYLKEIKKRAEELNKTKTGNVQISFDNKGDKTIYYMPPFN